MIRLEATAVRRTVLASTVRFAWWGRRNSYKINTAPALGDPIVRQQNVGELLALLTHKPPEH